MLVRYPSSDRFTRSRRTDEYRRRSVVGFWVAPVLMQFTPGVDCMLALVVGLFGGMLAGLTMSHMGGDEGTATLEDDRSGTTPMRSTDSTEPSEHSVEAADPILTDDERIVRLLISNGGRMKQSRIVDETGWSKAKVSRLLSSMEDEKRIAKRTLGRENVILLDTTDGPYASVGRSEG